MGAKPVVVLYASISVLNLIRAANWKPVQGDKERCNMGSFGLVKTSRAAALTC